MTAHLNMHLKAQLDNWELCQDIAGRISGWQCLADQWSTQTEGLAHRTIIDESLGRTGYRSRLFRKEIFNYSTTSNWHW